MNKHMSRAVAMLLTLCMVLTMLPVSIFAAESDGEMKYLSDMEWVSAKVGWPVGAEPGRDEDVGGSTIVLDGKTYSKGLCAHAASEIVYNINGLGVSRFTADIGLDDDRGGNVNFVVMADGEEIYRKNDVKGSDATIQVDIEVPEGAKTLTLITETNGEEAHDHSAWGDAAIYVNPDPSIVMGISLDKTEAEMDANDTLTLAATVVPDTAADKTVVWESSDEYVATVEDGVVTAQREGETTITASCGGYTAKCEVTVSVAEEFICDWEIEKTTVGWGGLGVHQGVIPVSGEPDALAFGGVAYEHGLSAHTPSELVFDIEGKRVGAFFATVGTNADNVGTCGYIVKTDVSEEALFDMTVQAGESAKVAVAIPEEATKLILITTDPDGNASGDHSTWYDPMVVIGSAEVYVPVAGIELDKSELSLAEGTMNVLTATVNPADATDGEVVWSSSNESVATVEDGIVTGILAGTAVITAKAGNHTATCAVEVYATDYVAEKEYLCEDGWYEDNLITASAGWGQVGVHTAVINPNTNAPDGNNKYIKIGGEYYDHGFSAHAASQMVFDIENMGVKTFSAVIGLHNDRKGSCGFRVLADKEVLYSVDCINGGQTRSINVAVPEDAKLLILQTTDGGNGNDSDHSVWADPMVTVDTAYAGTLRRVELTTPSFMKGNETATASVTGLMVEGNEADLSNAEIVYTSSNEDVLKVDSETGELTIVGRGTANISVTVTLDGTTRTASNMITVDDGSGERAWELKSPNGEVAVSIAMGEDNDLTYSAVNGGKTIVSDSVLGIDTDMASFTDGLLWAASSTQEVDTSYTMMSGKASEIDNHYNELVITFVKGNAVLDLELRAYDDGFAYRYNVSAADGSEGELKVYGETGTFDLPAESKLFYMDNADRFDHKFNHEGSYEIIDVEDVYTHVTKHETDHNNIQQIYLSMPLLVESTEGLWTMITEANLYGDAYVGSYLDPNEEGTFTVTIPDQQEYWTGHAEIQTTYPMSTPWRLAVSGELGDIVESTMVTDVADDPSTEIDWSFVETGVTSWTWLSEGLNGQKEEEVVRKYVDLAYEMGWSYYIMDEGWQPRSQVAGKRYDGYYEWFDGMVEYAAERGVGLVAWILAHDLDTPEELAVLAEYAEKGIVGIKVDFFDIDDQDTIELYKKIYEECAKHGLIVNCHGANKPTGEARTYPNVINREAVAGQEFGGINTYQSTFWPFARNVVGPMDITPHVVSAGGTEARMNALFVMFESGMPCIASSAEQVQASPAYSLLKGLPSSWDEIHYIDGYPGEFATLARRSGENWYAASINGNTQTRTARFPLDFLTEGEEYCAIIYRDNVDTSRLTVEYKVVTSADTLEIEMLKNGGCTVKIQPLVEGMEIEMESELTLKLGESAALNAVIAPEEFADTDIIWTTSDGSVASVADGVVTAEGIGAAMVTATSSINPMVSASAVVLVEGQKYVPADGWTIDNPSAIAANLPKTYADNPNKISLRAATGDVDFNGGAQNVWLMDAPEGDFELTIQVTGGMTSNYEKIGLVAWHDATNSVSTVRRYHSSFGGNVFGMFSYLGGYVEPTVKDGDLNAPAYLKLTKEGNKFYGAYSWDGETWTSAGQIENAIVGESDQLQIGVYCVSGNQAAGCYIDVENFTVNGTLVPFTQAKTTADVLFTDKTGTATVEVGTDFEQIEVRRTVEVYLDNGTKRTVEVKWNGENYNKNRPGDYQITGEMILPEGVENSNNVVPTFTVTVEGEYIEEHTLVHVEAVEPGCHYLGNIEYWYCTECEMFWQDEALTQLTNSKNVILPATGEGDVEHVAAKEPTHTENGNIEYWHCADCEQYWQDEALTQLTNSKNVILPAEGCLAAAFTDVNLDAWYHEPIDFVLANGMMTGDKEGTFRPDVNISRAQVAQILYNMAEDKTYEASKTFSDVKDGQWFYDAVMWAAANGFVLGDDGADTFRPDAPITRQELVVIIWRYMGKNAPANAELTFADAAEAESWAVEAIAWASENEFVKGLGDNKFAPKANASRAQMTQILMNIFG